MKKMAMWGEPDSELTEAEDVLLNIIAAFRPDDDELHGEYDESSQVII